MSNLKQELAWLERTSPCATHFGGLLSNSRKISSKRIAFWTTIVPNAVPLIDPIIATGASVFVGACHPTTTDNRVVYYLKERGCEAYGSPEMDEIEYKSSLEALVKFEPDIIISTGGDAILACEAAGQKPHYCLEGTQTGINRLTDVQLSTTVWDWNSLALKQEIEHRFHVADGVWPAFMALTGLSLLAKTVTIVGFGAVGKGIADRAKAFGAQTIIVEHNALRRTEARFLGHAAMVLEDALPISDIVITATGFDSVISENHWDICKNGVILCNAGHSPLEIDVPNLKTTCQNNILKPGISLHKHQGKDIILLADGGVLNLSTSFGPFGNDVWDIFNGVMLAGLLELENAALGIQPFPESIANSVLETLEQRNFTG